MSVTLVTGGAGYIGSHTCVELLLAGRDVVVVDDACAAGTDALHRHELAVLNNIYFFLR